jgi:hypothetical protein
MSVADRIAEKWSVSWGHPIKGSVFFFATDKYSGRLTLVPDFDIWWKTGEQYWLEFNLG